MKTIKTIAALITFFLAGYLVAQFDKDKNVIQSTKSGDFIIRNGHIYTVQELTHDTFYSDLKHELNNKKGL